MMPFFDLSVIFFTLNLYDYLSPESTSLFGPKYDSSVGVFMWGLLIAVQMAKVYNKLA